MWAAILLGFIGLVAIFISFGVASGAILANKNARFEFGVLLLLAFLLLAVCILVVVLLLLLLSYRRPAHLIQHHHAMDGGSLSVQGGD